LYRQWIELGLKSIWQQSVRLGAPFGSVPKAHDLIKLWSRERPWFVENGFFSSNDEFVESAERIFSILNNLDPDGTAFRYPPTELPHSDILNLSLDDFERAIDEVDTIFIGLGAMLDQYGEMKSDMGG
jgi:hypothetical protein